MARKSVAAALAVQSSSTPAAALAHYDRDAVAAVFDAVEQDLGGRGKLLESLLAAPDSTEVAALIGLLADPRSDTVALSHLLQSGGVTLGQLIDTMKQAGFARALVRSIATIAEKTPAIVQDVMTRAATHEITCQTCDGAGTVLEDPDDPASKPRRCGVCLGKGRILMLPTVAQQTLALDLARMLPSKAAIVQNFDQRKAQMGSGTIGAMTDLIRATDDLLAHARPAPRAPVVEGTVVDSPPIDAPDPAHA